jgi:acyl carrier protein
MQIENRVNSLIKKFSKINLEEIRPSTNINDLKFDSLDLLEFQMAFDDEFGVEIPIDEFLNCQKVQDIILLVEKYPKKK